VSDRDRRILALATKKTCGSSDFDEALRALQEAVEELIPAGRIYFLGSGEEGPVIGSIISRVGIVPEGDRILVVRVEPEGACTRLGWFSL
jgi:hypothetical protein